MPGISVPELTERVAQLRPGLPTLFMSGYTEYASLQRRVLTPGKMFVHRPFSHDMLLRKLRETLDRGPAAV